MTEPCANEKCPHYPCTVKEFYSDGVIAMPHNLYGWYFKCASYFSKYNFKPDPNIGCYYIPDKQFGVSGVSTLESCPICGGMPTTQSYQMAGGQIYHRTYCYNNHAQLWGAEELTPEKAQISWNALCRAIRGINGAKTFSYDKKYDNKYFMEVPLDLEAHRKQLSEFH